MTPPRSRFLVPVLALIGFLGMGIAPAHGAPSLGTGLIRIDAGWATVKTLSNGEMVLTLDQEASGQWMGEVGASLKPVVRDIDDRNLVKSWDALGHDSGVGVDSTLTWNSTDNFQLLKLGEPSLTPRGHLRFVIEPASDMSADELPVRLEKVSVNITRAALPQTRNFPYSQNFALTATAVIQTTNNFAYEASLMFLNSGTNCYTATTIQQAPVSQLPANLVCGTSLTFSSGTLTMSLPLPSGAQGNVFFTSTMIVSGSPFSFSGIVAQWTQTGS